MKNAMSLPVAEQIAAHKWNAVKKLHPISAYRKGVIADWWQHCETMRTMLAQPHGGEQWDNRRRKADA